MKNSKKAIVFGTSGQANGIGSILKKNGVEVIEAPTSDSYRPLVAAIKKHRTPDLVVICGAPLNNNILYATQEVRRLSKSSILVVMGERRITAPSKEKALQAGATEVLHSPHHIEDEKVVLTAARMLGISLRLDRKQELPLPPRVVPSRPPLQLRVVPVSQTPPVASETAPPTAEPARMKPASISSPVPAVLVRTMDEEAAMMLDLATHLETKAKLLREWAEEILAAAQQSLEEPLSPAEQQEVKPLEQNILTDSLLTIGEIVTKGCMVTFHGRTFHLTHQQVKILDLLCRERGNGGASKELLFGLGIKTPAAISVIMSGLRERLTEVCADWHNLIGRCQNGRYPLKIPSQ